MIIISILATVVGIFINPMVPRLVMSVQVMVMAAGAILFHCKIPAINDIYGMRQEMKLITIATGVASFYFPIVSIAQGQVSLYIYIFSDCIHYSMSGQFTTI